MANENSEIETVPAKLNKIAQLESAVKEDIEWDFMVNRVVSNTKHFIYLFIS